MYILTYNPNRKREYRIVLDDTGRFYQLVDSARVVVAEANSWRRLKKHAELEKLRLTANLT